MISLHEPSVIPTVSVLQSTRLVFESIVISETKYFPSEFFAITSSFPFTGLIVTRLNPNFKEAVAQTLAKFAAKTFV